MRKVILSLTFLAALGPYFAKAADVNVLTDSLTNHVVNVVKLMRQKSVSLDQYCSQCSRDFQTRHLYQRAFDVDHALSSYMKMHGISQDDQKNYQVQFKQYGRQDLIDILGQVNTKLEQLLRLYQIESDQQDIDIRTISNSENYAALDRVENFLFSIGTPSIQPGVVYQRARAIKDITLSLCANLVCSDVSQSYSDQNYGYSDKVRPKMPLDVFRELNAVIVLLHDFIKKNEIEIEGGITVPRLTKSVITPQLVNRASGILLADLIAIRHQLGHTGHRRIPEMNIYATPTDVWLEINHARRILTSLQ